MQHEPQEDFVPRSEPDRRERLKADGTEMYRRNMAKDYGDPEISELMLKVWLPTPWMIDVFTEDREQEIRQWCYRMFGPASSPIHDQVGDWIRGSVTIHGWTWYGFKTQEMMERFQEQFPSPEK